MPHRRIVAALLAVITAAGASAIIVQAASAHRSDHKSHRTSGRRAHRSDSYGWGRKSQTATPIKHLVVIFQENVSFDHYFGTYPNATNPSGEPKFNAAPGTPSVNGLSAWLLNQNPNSANPRRLDRSQNYTCDQNHDYTAEQAAFDRGLMDKFVQFTSGGSCPDKSIVMDYYDGNTVTGLWNYAQHYSMSDNSYSDTFGPSTPGAINVTAGNTFGALCGPVGGTPPTTTGGNVSDAGRDPATINDAPCATAPGTPTYAQGSTTAPTGDPQGPGTVLSDADPNYDICSTTEDGKTAAQTIQMGGKNIGELLNQNHTTWGWFQGGFASPGYQPGDPSSDNLSQVCTGSHTQTEFDGKPHTVVDYNPHHEPFEYYKQTANPQHLPPTSIAMIGRQDQANHQYDLRDFWAAADNGNMPAVSYLKAASYQDGHAGYSSPLDEQHFLVDTINHLEKLPSWKSTAVVIAYDDSDGWYDHQMGPIVTQSQTPFDVLAGGNCGSNPPPSGQQGRCGLGMRQPLLVVSPFSRQNFVDNTLTTQSSVVRFIEDNWTGGQRIGGGSNDAQTNSLSTLFDFSRPGDHQLFLDPSTGEPTPRGQTEGPGSGNRGR